MIVSKRHQIPSPIRSAVVVICDHMSEVSEFFALFCKRSSGVGPKNYRHLGTLHQYGNLLPNGVSGNAIQIQLITI